MKPWTYRIVKTLAFVVAGLGIVGLAAVGYVLVAWDRPVARPAREMQAPRDPQTVARGEDLYQRGTLCWTCHGSAGTPDMREPQAGGRPFDLSAIGPGFGKVWSPNLTSDRETGVGAVSDALLVRAIREGIDHRGNVIIPVMAYQFYHGLSDADALAIVAYLRTLEPVRNVVPPRQPSFVAKALIAFGMVAPEAPVTAPSESPAPGPTPEFGRYLAWHASGCAECHTPRFPSNGQLDRSRLMGGALFTIHEAGFTTTAPNLTPDPRTGLGNWTEAQFVTALRTGTRPDGTVMLPFMPWPVYATWSDEDLHAVWLYLRSVPAVEHETPASVVTDAVPGEPPGAGIFAAYCAVCHGDHGRGSALTTLVLADEMSSFDDDTLSTIIQEGAPGSAMPAFDKTLTRDQVRDVIAYLRGK